jgi:hypothetical protein
MQVELILPSKIDSSFYEKMAVYFSSIHKLTLFPSQFSTCNWLKDIAIQTV